MEVLKVHYLSNLGIQIKETTWNIVENETLKPENDEIGNLDVFKNLKDF